MDTVFTAIERAALPKQVVYSDFAAAAAMIFDCQVHATVRGYSDAEVNNAPPGLSFRVNYLFKIAHCSWPRKGMFQPLISLIGPIVPTYLFTADK